MKKSPTKSLMKIQGIDNNLKLVLVFLVLFFLSGLYLFVVEAKNQDYQYHKKWSVVYLSDLRQNNLNFTIENYEGESTTYRYAFFDQNGKEISKGEMALNSSEIKAIQGPEGIAKGKVIIKFQDQEEALARQ